MYRMARCTRIALLVLCAVAAVQSPARETAARSDGHPVFVLQESTVGHRSGRNNTLWKLADLNPRFVLYGNGLVIFKKPNDHFRLYSVRLAPDEQKALLDQLDPPAFLKLEDSYSTNNQLDQPVYFIKYWQGAGMKKVRVIGNIRNNQQDRQKAPAALLGAFDRMISYSHRDARAWQPYRMEIQLYPFAKSRGKPAPWPREWPDLNHETTRTRTGRHARHAYSIYLEGRYRDRLEKMLTGLKPQQAVLINNKRWYLAPTRFILPNEQFWDTEKTAGPRDTLRQPNK